MRQIKFRGICREEYHTHHEATEVGEFIYGYLVFPNKIRTAMSEEHGGMGSGIVHVDIEVDPETVGEYTGLKDKNGQEIYGSDIIGVTHYFIDEGGEWEWESKHEVVWGGEDYPAFELKPSLQCECNGLSYLKCNTEVEMYAVIGNIYENPELLDND